MSHIEHTPTGRTAPPPRRSWRGRLAVATAAAAVAGTMALGAVPASAATASNGPGANAFWGEPHIQGFGDAIGSGSKLWYEVGDGQLGNVYHPQLDNPDTFGLQYYVSDGSTFTDNEVANTSHAIALADATSLEWQQTNTATSGKYTIKKTYVVDPARSVLLINTTFTNLSGGALALYAQYSPALNNDGMGNTGGTDTASNDLTATNGTVSSALAASTGFAATSTGYAGTTSDGASILASSHALSTTYTGVSSSGHITQTAQIPVAASGSTTFTLALAFDTSASAAVSDASASLGTGFAATETSFRSGWHTWMSGLNAAPASVTGNAKLLQQYYVSLMEVKADEDKTYAGGFVASPNLPWGASISANSAGQHGYHLVWTRDEYQMASALLAAGDTADASDALTYLLNYEETSSGYVKQNSWLNGNQVWGGTQEDEVAFPIILAYQLGKTDSATWAKVQLLANYIVSNGPYTGQERWEENGGYSPSTMAAEIAGLVCAASIATANGNASLASTYLAKADAIQSAVDADTYTTSGPLGGGSYYIRIAPNANPNASDTVGISNGGGSYDQRAVVDQGFLELSRLGVKPATSTQITNSLAVVDSTIRTNIAGVGSYFNRYNHDGYGETSSGGDYTGAGVGRPWPVLSGERGEYDVEVGNTTDAASMLGSMANAANAGYQISEQIWPTASADGFTQGQPDNSSTPLMWAMAQYARLAIDMSAGKTVETPAVVCQHYGTCGTASETVSVANPGTQSTVVNTAASLSISASDSAGKALTYSATGLPAGLSISAAGVISGTPTATGSSTVTVTATSGTATGSTTFTWTVTSTGGGGTTEKVTVTVPVNTDTAGQTVYLAGNLSVLGTGQSDWAANGVPMTRVDATHWTATISATASTTLAYKYDLGGSWNNVEETSACGYVNNRSMAVNGGTVTDTVGNWEGPNTCGTAAAVITVTVPSGTPSTAAVYISGNYSALGTGMSSANDWNSALYPMTKVDATHWKITVTAAPGSTLQYKYTLGTWTSVEETGSCAYANNRSFVFGAAGSSPSANDTVPAWEGTSPC